MKIFNIDLHISVIADIKQVLESLGHQVISWNMSGHNWVWNRQRASVDVINPDNWHSIDWNLCDRFYDRYKDELSQFDAFLTTYPPCFTMLFKRFNKPIIMVSPIRYEVPFTNKPELWRDFNTYLIDGIDNGQIIPVANNKFDAKYCEYFLNRPVAHIPNLCGYTNAEYTPRHSAILYYSRLKQYSHYLGGSWIDDIIPKEKLGHGYKWHDLTSYRGIIHIPYNTSTMTIFENYTSNMPMFVPSIQFMRQLRLDYPEYILCETTWAQTWNLESKSVIVDNDPKDPNNYKDIDNFMEWTKLADFYDQEWMPHIIYFDSFHHLRDLIKMDLRPVSNKMKEANINRRARVYDLWSNIVKRIGN